MADFLSDAFDGAAIRYSKEMELRERVHSLVLDAIKSLFDLEWTSSAGEFNTGKSGTQSLLDRLYGGVAVESEIDMNAARREHGARLRGRSGASWPQLRARQPFRQVNASAGQRVSRSTRQQVNGLPQQPTSATILNEDQFLAVHVTSVGYSYNGHRDNFHFNLIGDAVLPTTSAMQSFEAAQ